MACPCHRGAHPDIVLRAFIALPTMAVRLQIRLRTAHRQRPAGLRLSDGNQQPSEGGS